MAHETKTEIDKIMIGRAENGYIYRVCGTNGGSESYKEKEYVYDSIEDVLDALKDDLGSPHIRKSAASKEDTEEAFREVHENMPKVAMETKKKKGDRVANRQMVAIALSKSNRGLFKK